jgi:hypothetical protein
VNPLYAYPLPVAVLEYVEIPVSAKRLLVLGDLVPFGKIRIIIVFPGKDTSSIDGTVRRQSGLDSEIDHFFVENRECPGQTHASGAGVTVGLAPELRGAATEDLAFREQVRVHLETDYAFITTIIQVELLSVAGLEPPFATLTDYALIRQKERGCFLCVPS